MSNRRNWTRDELLLAINLYCKIPFGSIHSRNPKIIELAEILGRSPGAVGWKLVNFAHIDPSLDRKGASHVSKLDREVWADFFNNWDSLTFRSECILHEHTKKNPELSTTNEIPSRMGKDIERTVKTRVNQQFFRRMILTSYNEQCCLTGLSIPDLLVASHIKPWASDLKNRTNPQNGLCLNALHDKAFDRGLITLSNDYKIIVSAQIKHLREKPEKEFLLKFEGKQINLPSRFIPDKSFISFHRDNIFQ